MPRNEMTKLLMEKIEAFDKKLDEVRTKDLPEIHKAMGVLQVQVEERTGKKAMLYSTIGGAIAVVTSIGVSVAVAMFLK